MNNNYLRIKNHIKSLERYQITGNEELITINYKLLQEDINNINPELIKLLLRDELCKELFFDKIEDIYIFNQNKFIEILFNTNEYMDGSYTKYENKIGLFLKDEDTVQLNFPYKDCVLVGGMDKEDDKVNLEIFYNETLERDKINKLFEPKVFENVVKYSFDESLKVDDRLDNPENIQVDYDIDRILFETVVDEDGTEKQRLIDNLLIKGNNLLGLHSLARRMHGMIDVIYIDPPYYFNDVKSSDSFAYNSNFKLSTWLTFIKNRLEIARELLSDTGVIFISMNEDGNSHLKLLCDDIFGANNIISNLIWKQKYTVSNDKLRKLTTQTENILLYSKTSNWEFKPAELKESYIKDTYKNPDNDLNGLYMTVQIYKDKNPYGYEIISPTGIKWFKNWNFTEENMKTLIENGSIYFGKDGNALPRKKVYLKDSKGQSNVNLLPPEKVGFTSDGTKEMEVLFKNKSIFPYPKPVSLIKHLFEMSSKKDSIIIDFFGGSGTSAHSILSLNKEDNGDRKFILLEQMNYANTITAERIKRSMINYSYEDSFIYMEMKESKTKEIKNELKAANSKEELISIIEHYFDTGIFINIDNKEQILLKIEDIYSKSSTKSNPLNDSIKLIIEKHMDNNLDYVSYEDIEELKESDQISDNEYRLNKFFYEEI